MGDNAVLKNEIKESGCSDLVAAVAIGHLKESKRFELTKTVIEASSCDPALHFLSRADLVAARVTIERSASIDVCRRATEIAKDIAAAGITVVSGLALGIDGAAHRGALDSKIECATIAVLAHGLDRVYPPSHLGLAREIVSSGGIIISEYAPGVEPLKHHFLARNRIIAGLSRGVLVVQAGARSGSLVTANFAADYGRDVFVFDDNVPGDASSGGSSLIDQGAIAVRSARDILAEYGLAQSSEIFSDESAWTTTTLETFLNVTKLSSSELLKLELAGLLIRLPGNQVRVRN